MINLMFLRLLDANDSEDILGSSELSYHSSEHNVSFYIYYNEGKKGTEIKITVFSIHHLQNHFFALDQAVSKTKKAALLGPV
jgi:hypothetical protein